MMLIEARNLSKSFGGHRAVTDVSFAIPASNIVGLLGSNGAGKSTTMRMLAGTLRPDSGTGRIAGFDISESRRCAQEALGYLPEAANGFANLTVLEFLTFAAEARIRSPRARPSAVAAGMQPLSRRASIDRAITLLDLGSAVPRQLGELSKGWRQRAWLAQALIHDPAVLILDEPTDGLDPKQKVDLRMLLRSLSRDRAILMSTHIVEEAEELCDRLIVMTGGRVVADAARDELNDANGRLAPALIRLMSAPAPALNCETSAA